MDRASHTPRSARRRQRAAPSPFYLVRTGVTGAARESAGAMTVDSYPPGPGSRSATVLACTLNGPLVVSATTSSSSSGRSGSRETLGGAMWRVGI